MLICTGSAVLNTEGGSVACCLHFVKHREKERLLLKKDLKTLTQSL